VLAADPTSASIVRDQLRKWLGILHWPADAADDVVMAISEAVSNSVDHTYPDGHSGEVATALDVAGGAAYAPSRRPPGGLPHGAPRAELI
jgi:anti-sigma regulatory factor (Ser/Thr protein kinase)